MHSFNSGLTRDIEPICRVTLCDEKVRTSVCRSLCSFSSNLCARERGDEEIDRRDIVSDEMFFNWTCLTIGAHDRSIDVDQTLERRPTIDVHAPYRSDGGTFLSRLSSWITRAAFSSADLRDLLHKWFSSSLRWNVDSRPLSSVCVYLSVTLLLVLFSLLIFLLLSYSKSQHRVRSRTVHSSLLNVKNLSFIVLIVGNVFLSVETLSLVRHVQDTEVNLKHSLEELQRDLSPQTLENIRHSFLEQFQDVDRQFRQGNSPWHLCFCLVRDEVLRFSESADGRPIPKSSRGILFFGLQRHCLVDDDERASGDDRVAFPRDHSSGREVSEVFVMVRRSEPQLRSIDRTATLVEQ